MKYRSVFDIIGPVMVGPSSSHTAGAARLGFMARAIFGRQPQWATVRLYGSFAKTYRGHGTDVAIVGGILGLDTWDPNLPKAFQLARDAGVETRLEADDSPVDHPNTARLLLGDGQEQMELVGISTGGGRIEIVELNGFHLAFAGNGPAVLVFHKDRPGMIAEVAAVLARCGINIGHMEVSRQDVGGDALMVMEIDQTADESLADSLASLPFVSKVTRIDL